MSVSLTHGPNSLPVFSLLELEPYALGGPECWYSSQGQNTQCAQTWTRYARGKHSQTLTHLSRRLQSSSLQILH